MCTFRELDCENDLLHCMHIKGFSPVCVLMCSFSLLDSENDLLHCLHTKGFSPECILMCAFRELEHENELLHSLHMKGFSPVCLLMCTFRRHECKNDSLHTLHVNNFSLDFLSEKFSTSDSLAADRVKGSSSSSSGVRNSSLTKFQLLVHKVKRCGQKLIREKETSKRKYLTH
jgi:hypothetical protein